MSSYGDGLTSETLQPSQVRSGSATLSIDSSSFVIDKTHTEVQISFVLDTGKKSPIPEVTLSIIASKGEQPLFEHNFKSDDGIFLIRMIPDTLGNISVTETSHFLSEGKHNGNYDIKVPIFNSGGLYRFNIHILTKKSYNNQVNESYNAGISIPETKYQIKDESYGKQNVTLTAYYDNISNFHHDSNKKTINFVMPFNWTENNIKHISVVHQEIKIPKSFSDFVATKYDAYVNGVKLSNSTVNMDYYSSNDLIIYLILHKQEIINILKKQNASSLTMIFSLSPSDVFGFSDNNSTSEISSLVPEFPLGPMFVFSAMLSSLILIPKFIGK